MKLRSSLPAFAALSLASSVHGTPLPPIKGEKAIFEISPAVVVKDPPRFGANIDCPGMSPWGTAPWHNQWISGNPNPVTARIKGTATGGSELTLENMKSPRIGYYDVFRDGYFDGGTAAVYRLEDGKVSLVREGKIAKFEASKEGANRVTFAAPGPEVKAGDEYVITCSRTEFPASVTRTMGENPWWLVGFLAPKCKSMSDKDLYEAGVRGALVAGDVPPGGGGASFALTVPAGWNGSRVSVGNQFLNAERLDWPKLHNGKIYTLRLWLKQKGMATGAVDVKMGDLATANFKVTDKWQEYTADFTAALPKKSERFEIGTTEAGTLGIDKISLVEKDGPPNNGFYPAIVDTLKRFHPSTLRIWTLQQNRGFGKCLDDALGDPALSNLTFRELNGAGVTSAVGLHQQLELCEQVGTDPWIITSTMFSAQEQKNLIEYLAGPATSPYGKKRADWGHPRPWTDTFHRIKLEMGNETWNRMFAPQNFSGRPALYGAYAEFMFQQMKSSPWFKADKFLFLVNGWIAQTADSKWAYGYSALRAAPSAQGLDIGFYTGGWDAVGLIKSESVEEGWMNVMTYSRRMLAPRSHEFKETIDKIAAEQGRPGAVRPYVYEAGPGYTLPGPGKPVDPKEQEEGKSLAQAINSLDIFMTNLREGYDDQGFFTFKNSDYWASHNRKWGEHIAWKALGMRNALLAGDMITATPKAMVTMDLPESEADVVSQSNSANKKVKKFPAVSDLPMIDCYPFQQGKHHSFMLISRRLEGATKTTLELPYEPESKYTVHTLTADSPAAHNIDEEKVKVVTQEKTGMTKAFTFDIPAHSVVVIVNEAK